MYVEAPSEDRDSRGEARSGEPSRARLYRAEVKAKQITIYEYAGTDPREVVQDWSERSGLPGFSNDRLARSEAEALARGQFAPVLRFTLIDGQKRRFKAERMCYLGSTDAWIALAFDKPIEELARALIPVLESDEFFALFQGTALDRWLACARP